MTPITSSPGAAVVPGGIGDGLKGADGAGGSGVLEVNSAPTAIPHSPQNFVVVLTGAPQLLQVILSGGDETGGGTGVDTTGVPQIPQNFSVPLIGLPQDRHTGRETGGGGTSVLGISGEIGAAGDTSTFARHLPQNLSPGLIVYPHDRHNRVPGVCEGCDAGGGVFREGWEETGGTDA
jgi:hypothetical protein